MLIWGGLVVLLIAVLIVGVIWLWRKLGLVAPELERLDLIQQELAELAEQAAVPYTPRKNALLRALQQIVQERDAFVDARDDRREARRERKLERAHTLIHADPMQFQYLIEHPKKG